MDKGKIAEWFMSLVLERPQAATIVGDLLETGAARGAAWFWSNVFRTWCASVWRDGKSQPRFILGIATLGLLVQFAAGFTWSLTHSMLTRLSPWDRPSWLGAAFQLWMVVPVITVLSGFFVGRWVARFSRGRDVAICMAMVCLEPLAFNVIFLLVRVYFSLVGLPKPDPLHFIWRDGWIVLSFIPYLLGAILVRQRLQAASAA